MNILEKMKGWFMSIFNKKKIEQSFGIKLATDENLQDLIEKWLNCYQGHPHWVGSDKNQVEKSLNVASTICNDLATKCVSEIAMQETADKVLQDFWDNEVKEEIRQQVEYALASGAVIIRPFYNEALKKISLSWYTADRFIPVDWQGRQCMSGIFIDQEYVGNGNSGKYYTKLEFQRWIYGTNGQKGSVHISVKAFESSSSYEISKQISLSEYPKWANIPPETDIYNLPGPLFVYAGTPFANNKKLNSHVGVSLFKDGMGILEDIDRTYDSLDWERDSTQHKVFVNKQLLATVRNEDTGKLEVKLTSKENRLFQLMDAQESGSRFIDEYSPQIRQADITAILKTQLSLLCSTIHLDSGAYVYDENAQAVTAKEITSKLQKTYQTITDIQKWCVTPALKKLFEVVSLWQKLYKIPSFSESELIVSYGDSILVDEESDRENAQRETQYGLRSKKTYLMEYRGMSEEEADAEIERINAETPKTVDFFGNNE